METVDFIERMCQISSSEITENVTWSPRFPEKNKVSIKEFGEPPISLQEESYYSYSSKSSNKSGSMDMRKLRQRHQRIIKTSELQNNSITSMVRECNGGSYSLETLEKRLTEPLMEPQPLIKKEELLETSNSGSSAYNSMTSNNSLYDTADEVLSSTLICTENPSKITVSKKNALMANLPAVRNESNLYDDLEQESLSGSIISSLADLSVEDCDSLMRDQRINLLQVPKDKF